MIAQEARFSGSPLLQEFALRRNCRLYLQGSNSLNLPFIFGKSSTILPAFSGRSNCSTSRSCHETKRRVLGYYCRKSRDYTRGIYYYYYYYYYYYIFFWGGGNGLLARIVFPQLFRVLSFHSCKQNFYFVITWKGLCCVCSGYLSITDLTKPRQRQREHG